MKTLNAYSENGYSEAQLEIQSLLKLKDGWNYSTLARKAGYSPQTTHNHLFNNSDLSGSDYLLYKGLLTHKNGPGTAGHNITVNELKEQCFEIIGLEVNLERDLDTFSKNDNIIDLDELSALKAKRNVIVNHLDRFIELIEQNVNQVIEK